MGSVYVHYFGSCRDRDVQQELLTCLREIAAHSQARILGPAEERPEYLKAMTAERHAAAAEVEPMRAFNGELSGAIVVDPLVSITPPELMKRAEQLGVSKVVIDQGGMDKEEAFCISTSVSEAQWCLQLSSLKVTGVDFELFDPRKLYPSANRMSFTFLDCPEIPELDGSLVQVENRAQCQVYHSERLQSADWFLTTPRIHLRYLLEEWVDTLLCWVKYSFMPNLHFSRYDELSGYEAFQEAVQGLSPDIIKTDFVGFLIVQFEKQVQDWSQQFAGSESWPNEPSEG